MDTDVEFCTTSGNEAQYFGPRTFIHLALTLVREKGITNSFTVLRLYTLSDNKSLEVKYRLQTLGKNLCLHL